MKRIILTIALIVSLLPLRASAALDLGFAREDGGQAGAFLEYANSARSLAMAGASTAVADDASAVISNPAGLSQIQQKNVVASYSRLFEDTRFSAFNYAQPTIDLGTFGVGLVDLHSGSFDRRDTLGFKSGSFAVSETALLVSHGIELNPRWSIGSGLKVIRQQVDDFSGTGYGLDGSAMYRLNPSLNFGLILRNVLAPHIKLRDETDRYPLEVRLGGRWQATRKLMVATDLDRAAGRSVKPRLGGEYAVNPLLSLRAGLSETEMSAGVGFHFKDWGIDYAFGYNDAAAGIGDLGASQRVGFYFNFGKKVYEEASSARWLKKGQETLVQLREMMDEKESVTGADSDKLLAGARQVIRRQGFPKAEDLYAAQGYVSFFEGEYERSVQSLGEALALDPQDSTLARHLEIARAQMTEERTKEIVNVELKRLKDLYDKGDWKGALKSCERILSFRPDNIEAATYIDDIRKRINEPIEREMKIAVAKYNRGEYLDAIKSLQHVKEMDPENKQAADYMQKSIAALENQSTGEPAASHAVYEVPRNTEQSRQLYSKGLLLYSQGNLKEAARMWEQAVQYDTKNAMARSAYNRVQVELRDKP